MTQIMKQENNSFSMTPRNLNEAIQLADRFAKSNMTPKTYINNPNAILVAWEYGNSLGLGLMQSLQSIAVINGMPTIWGDTALALVKASGLMDSIDESIEGQCTVKRKGENPVTVKFSIEEAKKAGITNRGVWLTYPSRMLKLRNRAFALRDVFPDVLKGMQISEEVQDYPTNATKYPDAIDTSKYDATLIDDNFNDTDIIKELIETKPSIENINELLTNETLLANKELKVLLADKAKAEGFIFNKELKKYEVVKLEPIIENVETIVPDNI